MASCHFSAIQEGKGRMVWVRRPDSSFADLNTRREVAVLLPWAESTSSSFTNTFALCWAPVCWGHRDDCQSGPAPSASQAMPVMLQHFPWSHCPPRGVVDPLPISVTEREEGFYFYVTGGGRGQTVCWGLVPVAGKGENFPGADFNQISRATVSPWNCILK